MQFDKLRLSGFKSFVEPTELLIEPGLTGIVGPNGCGKSNLVEALRWAMGETSAKSMRGGAMDDVIFGGSVQRPARNVAEVVLHLDNDDRSAPAPFNEFDELEISRRIEREHGSLYRVNGRETRARDVQLLFADLATGAHSTAIVNQGQIGRIISAKPAQRRAVLEEAAGITGLHSRRHEAELRLRGAESNLARLDDVLQALEAQLQGLRRQARQAKRYRNLSDLIRKAEAMLFHLRWSAACDQQATATAALRVAEDQLAGLASEVARATTAQAEAAAALAPLRTAEAEAAATLQRHVIARNQLDAEEQRISAQREQADARVGQIDGDIAREDTLAQDAAAALTGLETEDAELRATEDAAAAAIAAADARVDEAEAAAARCDDELSALTDRVAEQDAGRAALGRRVDDLRGQIERLEARRGGLAEERARLDAELAQHPDFAALERTVADAEADLASAGAEAARCGEALSAARAAEEQSAEALRAARDAEGTAASEAEGLRQLLATGAADGGWRPVHDALRVDAGFEAALAAALGDDLEASTEPDAPLRWQALPPLADAPALPPGARPLDQLVRAPAALARRLAQIGVVDDAATGAALQTALRPGQRLVSRDGGLWRWDGLTSDAGRESAAGLRLRQRNRLAELEAALAGLGAAAARAAERQAADQAATGAALAAETAARDARGAAAAALDAARAELAKLSETAGRIRSRLAAMAHSATELDADLEDARAGHAAAELELSRAPDPAADRARLAGLREQLAELRRVLAEKRSERDRLAGESEARRRRLDGIAEEKRSWSRRAESAAAQRTVLAERLTGARAEVEALAQRPAEIADQRARLLSTVAAAEAQRSEAADALASGEAVLAEADKALRASEAAQADGREARVRAEAAVEQATQLRDQIAGAASERLQARPEDLLALSDHRADAPLPAPEAIESKVERLTRERENMGAVNLRAETEAEELEAQITGMQAEREDLIAAIARLRQAIGQLNREGRERLLESFEKVNAHFRDLFVRLFGGGKAYLTLVESDDPLEAGLEIMASPPGKRLQVLSLLSGGEQALTAIALQFAVFLTNPSPICVLDEVDAPLDDNNVDRFCTLLDEMSAGATTRFLVVTHHRLTMARMHRLFGVTMAERGVSQLASVDLQSAERMRQSA